MAESHSKGEQRHRPLTLAATDSRTALSKAAADAPFKPYVYGGGDTEPPAVTAARERHLANNAKIDAARAALDAQEAGDG